MGGIPVLNDKQMGALRRLVGTNQKFDLTNRKGANARRFPVYPEEETSISGTMEYKSFFKLEKYTPSGGSGTYIRIIDGGGSGYSIAKVNNVVFRVADWTSQSAINADTTFCLKYENSAVSICTSNDISEDTVSIQIGRIKVDENGNISIYQDLYGTALLFDIGDCDESNEETMA